jgi:hypothetical protein
MMVDLKEIENHRESAFIPFHSHSFYPVRNNAPLLPPGQRPSGPAAAAGLHFRTIPAGFNAPLEFLTGFTTLFIKSPRPIKSFLL